MLCQHVGANNAFETALAVLVFPLVRRSTQIYTATIARSLSLFHIIICLFVCVDLAMIEEIM